MNCNKRIHIYRQLLGIILTVAMMFTASGCKKEKPPEKAESDAFDIKVATNIVDVYMKYLIKEDTENYKKLLSKELLKDTKADTKSDLKVRGYNLSETNEVGRSGVFKVKVASSSNDKSAASLDEVTIKVGKEESDYKITDIKSTTEKEAYTENQSIRLRMKNNVKTNLLIDKSSMPRYAFSKDDKANVSKIDVPKSNFGNMNFSYNGNDIAISTQDKDSFIGIVKIDESLAVQGGGGGGQSGGAGGGGEGGEGGQGQGGQDKQGSQAREKPVGKEVTTLDILKGMKVEFMTFSLDEKLLAVQFSKQGGGKGLRVYKTDSGDLIPFRFEDKYPVDKADILFSSFDKDILNYEVSAKNPSDKDKPESVGKYQMNLKDFKPKKVQ